MAVTYEISVLTESDRTAFEKLSAEYLPGSDLDVVRERSKKYGKAFLTAKVNGEVIGAAFGWERRIAVPEDDSFCLDGIAVKEQFHRMGIGRKMLKIFESAAAEYGCDSVSVGSAGGYVERFYISCGYVPKEYKLCTDEGIVLVKTFRNISDYESYERPVGDGFVVMEKMI